MTSRQRLAEWLDKADSSSGLASEHLDELIPELWPTAGDKLTAFIGVVRDVSTLPLTPGRCYVLVLPLTDVRRCPPLTAPTQLKESIGRVDDHEPPSIYSYPLAMEYEPHHLPECIQPLLLDEHGCDEGPGASVELYRRTWGFEPPYMSALYARLHPRLGS